MSYPTPSGVAKTLLEALIKHIDSTFWLRDPALRQERRDLLTSEYGLLSDPLIEPVIPYEWTVPAQKAGEDAGLTDKGTELLFTSVFNEPDLAAIKLGEHQKRALQVALTGKAQRNPIITTGTGSGKTEAFLLPVLGRLLQESRTWADDSEPNWWWERENPRWSAMRKENRPAALRSLILYPTNALVEDQLVRLRRAIRNIRAKGGPQLWFGRYTSASPGGTSMPGPEG